jgi:hypothetical protein
MSFARVPYEALNARQRENYNFYKVAARLAEYGFTSLRLTDDYQAADFIALHVDGETILRVQLKGRLTFDKKYVGKALHIAFRLGERVFVYSHDELLNEVGPYQEFTANRAWIDDGLVHWGKPPAWAMAALESHEI